ncbi:MAG: hypothetical protein KAS77_12870, partial [Thermoplasmata archaeon]|nr:hypothetical protein [Thermoplasmata archaeon]
MMRPPIALLVVLLMVLGPVSMCLDNGPTVRQDRSSVSEPQPEPTPSASDAGTLLTNIQGHFTENLGQMDEATFYCVGDPLSVVLGPGWVNYFHRSEQDGRGVLVRVEFPGANTVEPIGSKPLSHPTNILKGNDPDGWIIGAPSYAEVRYTNLWDGIDLVYRFEDGFLKYEFIVAPLADASQIRLRYSGHSDLIIDDVTGDLVIRTPVIDIVDLAPVSFQEGITKVKTRYIVTGGNIVSFNLDGYDPDLPLTIDPGLLFSTFVGGDGVDGGTQVLVDENGDILVCGPTTPTDFPTTPGVIGPDNLGEMDGYVLKLKGDGTAIIWSTYIGSDGKDSCTDIKIADDGNLLLTGFANGTDFPTTPGVLYERNQGEQDAFVMEISANGSDIHWSTL